MKTTKTLKPNRRNFLLAAGLGSAGVAAAVVARTGVPVKKADATEAPASGSGYQASEHVLKYYKTTEV
jgi:hypothetical protein